MRESATYPAILEEGREKGHAEGERHGRIAEARRILVILGRKRFGQPTQDVINALDGIADPGVIEELAARVLDVESWTDLLTTR